MLSETNYDQTRGSNCLKRYLDQEDRSEKKKNREKYRRNEVNEKFNELADVMDMAEKFLFTGQVNLEPGKTSSSKSDHICRAITMINSFVKENLFLKHQIDMQAQNNASPPITNFCNDNQSQTYSINSEIIDTSKNLSIPLHTYIHTNNLESVGGYHNNNNNLPQNTCCQQLYSESTLNSDVTPIFVDSIPVVNKSIPQAVPDSTHEITRKECSSETISSELHPIDCNCQKNKDQEEIFDIGTWEDDFYPFLSLSMWDVAEIPAPTHAEVA